MSPERPSLNPGQDQTFIGRQPELNTLLDDLQHTIAGASAMVLVTGEPGIGKSRLLDELRRDAVERGVQVLDGFAIEAGGMPPYFPLVQALRASPSTPAGAGAALTGLLASATGDSPEPAAPSRLSPEAERLRLFESVAQTLTGLCDDAPVLLTFDDMQWADASTWEVLTYVRRALGHVGLFILLAVRSEALNTADTPAARAIAELSRLRLLRHVALRPLASQDIAALASSSLQGRVSGDLVTTLTAQTDGNPFYVEELLRSLVDTGSVVRLAGEWTLSDEFRQAPRFEPSLTLRLSLGQRLNALPPATVDALKHAAVLGRTFSSTVLATMMEQDTSATEQLIAPAVTAGMVRPAGTDWSFGHDVIRETVYALASGEHRRLHAAAAGALEQGAGALPPLDLLVSLAYHHRLAGDWDEGARWTLEASAAARARHAYPDALAYARTGLDLMQKAEAGRRPSPKLLAAFTVLGEAALAAAEFEEADSAFRSALNEAEALEDNAAQATMWLQLGVLARRREQPDQAAASLRQALAIFEALGRDDAGLIEVLTELAGLEGLTRARYDEAEAYANRAMSLAARLGLRDAEAKAALALANSRTRSDDPAAGASMLEQALEKALLAADPSLAAEACAGLSNSCYWRGEMPLALRYAERRRELAEQAGDLFGLRHAYTWKALVLSSFGRWQEARDLLALAEPLLSRLDSPEPIAFLKIVSARIDLETGDADAAYAQASEAVRLFEQMDPGTLVWYEGVLAQACLAVDRRPEADARIANVERLAAALPDSALPARAARAALGRIYADLRDADAGARCEAALRPFANDYHWVQVRIVLARLAALRGDRATALADLDAAEAWTRNREMRFDNVLARMARIEALGAEAPAAAIESCRTALRELGALHSLRELDALVGARTSSAPAQLTARELEVLRLVAQGMTNRQIAEALVLSERTVINHVSHIFAKIGVEHRSGATAFALRSGLL